MLFRKIGALIRGKVTPFQIMAACVLGAVIGFLPGWAQAPGLMVLTTLLLIILNANLLVAGLVGLGSRLLSLLAAPLLFKIGRLLFDLGIVSKVGGEDGVIARDDAYASRAGAAADKLPILSIGNDEGVEIAEFFTQESESVGHGASR